MYPGEDYHAEHDQDEGGLLVGVGDTYGNEPVGKGHADEIIKLPYEQAHHQPDAELHALLHIIPPDYDNPKKGRG